MPQDHDEPRPEMFDRVFDRTADEIVGVVSGNPRDEEVAEPLNEDEIRHDARIGAAQNRREGRLALIEQLALFGDAVRQRGKSLWTKRLFPAINRPSSCSGEGSRRGAAGAEPRATSGSALTAASEPAKKAARLKVDSIVVTYQFLFGIMNMRPCG